MTTLTLKFFMTDEGRQQAFIKTGVMPPLKNTAEYDMTQQATAEQRATILPLAKIDNENIVLEWAYGNTPHFSKNPTLAELAQAAATYTAEQDAKTTKHILDEIASNTKSIRSHIKKRDHNLPSYAYMKPKDIADAKRLSISLDEYETTLAEYKQLQPEFAAEAAERKARSETYDAEKKAEREARQAELKAMKTTWIEQHGSEHLRRACLAEGYDCQRLYVNERAAVEAPGFTPDISNTANWKDRSCPSVKALDALDVARKFDLGEPLIVWLTEEPNAKSHEYYEDDFRPCEAVVIRNYLDSYDLIQIL